MGQPKHLHNHSQVIRQNHTHGQWPEEEFIQEWYYPEKKHDPTFTDLYYMQKAKNVALYKGLLRSLWDRFTELFKLKENNND